MIKNWEITSGNESFKASRKYPLDVVVALIEDLSVSIYPVLERKNDNLQRGLTTIETPPVLLALIDYLLKGYSCFKPSMMLEKAMFFNGKYEIIVTMQQVK